MGKTCKRRPITHTPPHDPINQACLEHCEFHHVDLVFMIPKVNVHVITMLVSFTRGCSEMLHHVVPFVMEFNCIKWEF